MCANCNERQTAARFGFNRPSAKNPHIPGPDSVHPAQSVCDKLGVKPGMRVALVGTLDSDLHKVIAERTTMVGSLAPNKPVDLILYQAENTFALKRVRELAAGMAPGGAMWVLWPRGQEHIKQAHVQRSGTGAGLVELRLASVSDRLSGIMFGRV